MTRTRTMIVLGLLLLSFSPLEARTYVETTVKVPGHGMLTVVKIARHENLEVFYLDATTATADTRYITMEEGIKAGTVTVSESKNAQVEELLVSNTSDKPLFIQMGELVRGGQQDRTLQTSLVVPPATKDMPLPSFCVEQSRWSGDSQFAAQEAIAPSSVQSGNASRSQGAVWKQVAVAKAQMQQAASQAAPDMGKTSSLNEELSSKAVKDQVKGYTDALAKLPDGKYPVGLAYAVNGKLRVLTVYHSSDLFKRLYPKLIASAAAEAAAENGADKPAQATMKDLTDFVAAAWDGKKHTEKLSADNEFIRIGNDKTWTCELYYKGKLVHSQVIPSTGPADAEEFQLQQESVEILQEPQQAQPESQQAK